MSNSRREILVTLTAVPVAAHVHDHEAQSAPPSSPAYQPQVFTPAEMITLGALVETILPRTKTPGALDARVHEIIDENLAARRSQIKTWRKGLSEVNALARRLHKNAYAALVPASQTAVMVELSNRSPFFQVLKDATVEAYYSTREGLMVELGWDAAKPMPEFKGCTHPEHQV
jgi:hypothetical protein